MLSKYAFGTSGDFNSIRSRGTVFGGVGKANGAEVVIDDFLAGIIGNFLLVCIWSVLM